MEQGTEVLVNTLLCFGLGVGAATVAVAADLLTAGKRTLVPSGIRPIAWVTMAFGFVSLALSLLVPRLGGSLLLAASVAAALATAIVGVAAILGRERHWPVWTGVAIGVVPASLWALALVGYFSVWVLTGTAPSPNSW